MDKVDNHVWVICPSGKKSSGDHDESGGDTLCNVTACATKEKLVNHTCAACSGS